MRTSFSRSRRRVRTREHAKSVSGARLAGDAFRALGRSAARLRAEAGGMADRARRMPTAIRRCCPISTYTLGARRNHHPHRLTLVARSMTELIEELDAFAIKRGEREGPHRLHAAPRAARRASPSS